MFFFYTFANIKFLDNVMIYKRKLPITINGNV